MRNTRKQLIKQRHRRIRQKLNGTAERPRLAVFRSHQHIYAQVIDDNKQHTLVSASTVDRNLRQTLNCTRTCEASAAVGSLLAERALEQGIKQVVFDRGGNKYHGRVRSLAEAAREGGLDF